MSLEGVQAHLIDSVDEAYEFMRWASNKKKIGFDTETTGLDKDVDKPRLVQIGDQETGWSIPWQRWGGVVEEFVKVFDGTYVMHNAPYDRQMMLSEGVNIPTHRIDDTRLKIHVLNSKGSLALKKFAKDNIDPAAAVGQDQLDEAMQKKGWTWRTVPVDFEPYWVYGALDPVLTMRADDILGPQVQREAPRAYDLELAVAWTCEKMERRGAMVDRAYTHNFADELEIYIAQVEKWCRDTYGVYPGSTDDIIKVLRNEGVNLVKRTPSGAKFSLDKDVLNELQHPLAQGVLGRRQAQKMWSTYLTTYLELSERDGFIHPNINTVGGTDKNPFEPGGSGSGVRTGRMSCSNPNLQNVPIRTKMGAKIRNCFAPRPDHTWIKCDADQIEMRILAHLSQDRNMVEAFKSDGDFFVNLASRLFNDPDFKKEDPRRQTVKNGGYAKIYGAGLDKFAKTAGATLEEAADFMSSFDSTFSGVPEFIREVERKSKQRLHETGEAFVRSPLTGRKHVADADREYALVNYLIQGMAGEVLKMKIVEADQAGLDEFMLFPVHDEIDLDVPNEDKDDVIATLRDVMNDDSILSVPVTWTPAVGDRWGNAKDV